MGRWCCLFCQEDVIVHPLEPERSRYGHLWYCQSTPGLPTRISLLLHRTLGRAFGTQGGDWQSQWDRAAAMTMSELRSHAGGWGTKTFDEWQRWLHSQPHTAFGIRETTDSPH